MVPDRGAKRSVCYSNAEKARVTDLCYLLISDHSVSTPAKASLDLSSATAFHTQLPRLTFLTGGTFECRLMASLVGYRI